MVYATRFRVSLFLVALTVALTAGSFAQSDGAAAGGQLELDLLFVNGTVIDGSGAAGYEADVGIKGDRIEVIGQDLRERYDADRVIDIDGRYLAPGYIDVHTHTGRTALGNDERAKAALNFLYQGITTVNIDGCGRHSTQFADQAEGQIAGQYEFIDANPFGMNVLILLGHDNLRRAVMGDDDYRRFSTETEWQEMGSLVRQWMEEGALGMSLGLEYEVGRWSDVEELVSLAKALADYDTRSVIQAHERATGAQHRYYIPSEHNAEGLYGDRFEKYPDGWDVIDYVNEAITIAERSGVVFDMAHMKVTHQPYFGRSAEIIELVETAHDRGLRIYAEHMPFTNSGNSPMNLDIIPLKYYGITGGRRGVRGQPEREYPYPMIGAVLDDPAAGQLLRADIAWQIDKHGGGESVDIIDSDSHPELVGKSLNDLSEEWNMPDLVDVILRVKEEGDVNKPNGATFRSFQTLSFEDVANFARTDWFGTVTDGGVAPLEGGFAQPRYFGAFPQKIEFLVKDNDVISLEHAVRAGTGLAAEMFSLPDRGLIREGYFADVQVFDLDEIEVKARWTLENSRAYSEGVHYVLVNGVFAIDDGTPTFALAGRSIRNQDAWGR
jgi:N-acyl-D-amino-acid deacylase